MNIAAIAHATARLRAVVDEYSGPWAENVASIESRLAPAISCQRRWPVSIEITALMPVLSRTLQPLFSRLILTGIRCTTLTQLPEMFSAGNGENAEPLAGEIDVTDPRHGNRDRCRFHCRPPDRFARA